MVCWQRKVLACILCDATVKVRCRATRDDVCAPCAERHRKDIARVIRSGMSRDRPEGFFFATFTGPGVERLRWDTSKCTHGPELRCSGSIGCKSERYSTAIWNARAPRGWNRWVTEMRRRLGVHLEFAGSWETQVRGVMHRHVVIFAPGVSLERMRTVGKWVATRPHVGFGRQFDCSAITGAAASKLVEVLDVNGDPIDVEIEAQPVSEDMAIKAGYIAKYATKGGDLAWTLDTETGEMRHGGYRRWSASRRWGCTMGSIRRERVEWCKVRSAAGAGMVELARPPGGAAGALELETEIYGVALLEAELGAVLIGSRA